jgi:hypothetical protein
LFPETTNAPGQEPEALESLTMSNQNVSSVARDFKSVVDIKFLSPAARVELERIVREHDRVAAAEVVEIAESLSRWTINALPLTDEERATVDAYLEIAARERQERVDAHRARLERTARFLGRQVGSHLLTLPDAERRLEVLVSETDPQTATPVALIARAEAVELVRRVFANAVREVEANV